MSLLPARLTAALADRYRLERELGQGGMATVYLAQDLRHDRQVAIKVLHEDLGAALGAERFLTEIKTTAKLQHPHILPLLDSGAAGGLLYYVMPYVAGETLRDRLSREKQLPLDDAVRIAREVADALGAAHGLGIIHRDIKPENILLQGGHALVADFGIALAVQHAGGQRMTQTGVSLGTPQYMSPEQAMGERAIDARADIYALGAVTYEMLTGEPPFSGATARAIVARMMTEDPRPIAPRRNTVPAELEDAVLVALARLPADRWGSAAEFAEALAGDRKGGRTVGRTGRQPPMAARPPVRLSVLIGALVLTTALALWGWLARPRPSPPPVTRLRIAMTPGQELSPVLFQRFAVSDDGRRLVYIGQAPNGGLQLWLRDLDAIDARPLAGTLGGYAPSFSPDGQAVVFVMDGTLRSIPVGGGEVTALADSVNGIAPGAAWLADGTIVFVDGDFEIRAVPPGGGRTRVVPRPAGDSMGRLFPRALPRSDAVLVVGCNDACNRMVLGALSLGAGEFRPIAEEMAGGWYATSGHIIAVRRSGAVVAIPFDVDRLVTRGDPVPLFDGVSVALGMMPQMWFAPGGTLLYERIGPAFGETSTLVRVTRSGVATPVDPDWPAAEFGIPSLSPDGKQVAIATISGQRSDVWIKRLDRGPLSRLTTEGALNWAPQWKPDGSEIAYAASGGGWHIRIRRPDGTGPVTRVAVPEATVIGNPNWTPDGRWLLVCVTGSSGSDIFRFGVGSDSMVPLLASSQFDELNAAIAPGGEWFAYQSNESGRMEIYLRPFPDAARERIPVSRNGGITPTWSRDGNELFFVSADRQLMTVPVTWSPRPTLGEPRSLFPFKDFVLDIAQPSIEPEPGGRSFLMLKREAVPASQLVLVLNWLEELKAKTKGSR